MKKVFLLSIGLIFCICSISLALTADEWVAQGDAALENFDTITAYQCYLNAYTLNPNHQGANFGLALLTLPHFLIDGGDSYVRNFLQNNGRSIVGNLYEPYLSSWKVENISSIPEIQNFIDFHILPYINQSITYLEKLGINFNKVIKKEMQPYKKYKEAEIKITTNENNDWYYSEYMKLTKGGNLICRMYGEDYLLLPSNVEVGLKWKPSKSCDEISEIVSLNETITTPTGTFNNCIKVLSFCEKEVEWGYWVSEWIIYFKEGIGMVKEEYSEEGRDYEGFSWQFWYKRELKSYSVFGTGYFPMNIGNKWEYTYESSEVQQTAEKWEIISITEIDEMNKRKDREWDYGETQAAKSILNLINGFLNVICAYNLDISYDDLKNFKLKEILNKYPSFLTLKSDGATKLNNALDSFRKSLDFLISGYDFINNETDPQDDDIIVLFKKMPESVEDFDYFKNDIRNLLSNLRETLNTQGADFDITDFWLKISYYSSAPIIKFPKRIDLSRFFTNPITRENLETLEFDEEGNLIISSLWNFDQTFNGAFPDLTKQEFVGFFKGFSYDLYSPIILNENSILLQGNINEISLDDIQSIKIYRDTDPLMKNKILVGTIYPEDIIFPEKKFEFIDNDAPNEIYYYMTVIDFKDGSYSPYKIRRSTRKIYFNQNFTGTQKGTRDNPYRYLGHIDFANEGSKIYVSEGTYLLKEHTKFFDGIKGKKGNEFIGSCNPITWESDLNSFPTIIDAEGKNFGFSINSNSSIKNFIIKNADYFGIGVFGSNNIIKNCLIYNCGEKYWGGGIGLWNAAGTNIINCTIVDNYNGIYGTDCETIKNSIIAENKNYGIYLSYVPNFSYNDVFGNFINYGSISDQTGINGNISQDPLFVDPANRNYYLRDGSPCIGAGEFGVDIGAYPYFQFQPGDINGDENIDISDVILCLRMAIDLPVTIGGQSYSSPYPNWLIDLADMNEDGVVDIADVIKLLRKSINLD